MVKRWGRVWAVGFVLWTLLAFLSAAGAHVYTASVGSHESWSELLAWNLTISLVWSVLTPPIWALSRRFTFDRGHVTEALLVHGAASVVLTLAASAAIVSLEPYVMWSPEPRAPIMAHTIARFLLDLQRYWSVVLIAQAIAYYGKYRERELVSSQLEAQLAHAQLDVLKIQLEPHFLFNTLNSIATLSRYDGVAAEHMTLQLADLLRLSLDAVGVQLVPLQRELDFLQKYVDIQQTRFRDRLRVEIDADPATHNAQVPNLILQPLVENAIRHGISPRLSPGWIRVSIRRGAGDLWVEIRDNGVGLRTHGAALSEGVGLRNTRARLRQLYSDDQSFSIQEVPGGGCQVILRMPFRPIIEEGMRADVYKSFAY